jgi:hypothetical protein
MLQAQRGLEVIQEDRHHNGINHPADAILLYNSASAPPKQMSGLETRDVADRQVSANATQKQQQHDLQQAGAVADPKAPDCPPKATTLRFRPLAGQSMGMFATLGVVALPCPTQKDTRTSPRANMHEPMER